MIISHRYRFIFIKTTKTAGTSVEIALARFCGPEDVVTPITPEDEEIRKELGYTGPQNYLATPREYLPWDIVAYLLRGKRKRRYYNHIPAVKVRARAGREIWDNYFKFCIERNPWDRAISSYYWRYQSDPRPTISEFVNSRGLLKLKRQGFGLYTIDGKVAVDKICRYENLPDELEAVRLRLGIPEALNLPRAKSRFRADRRSYRELMGEADKARVAEVFSEEIGLLGYEF